MADCRGALYPDGILLTNNGTAGSRWIGPLGRIDAALLSPFVRKQRPPFYAPVRKGDLLTLTELIEAGEVTPVIGSTFPLDVTSDAMSQVGEGHARGKVAITL